MDEKWSNKDILIWGCIFAYSFADLMASGIRSIGLSIEGIEIRQSVLLALVFGLFYGPEPRKVSKVVFFGVLAASLLIRLII